MYLMNYSTALEHRQSYRQSRGQGYDELLEQYDRIFEDFTSSLTHASYSFVWIRDDLESSIHLGSGGYSNMRRDEFCKKWLATYFQSEHKGTMDITVSQGKNRIKLSLSFDSKPVWAPYKNRRNAFHAELVSELNSAFISDSVPL